MNFINLFIYNLFIRLFIYLFIYLLTYLFIYLRNIILLHFWNFGFLVMCGISLHAILCVIW